jgi:YHS domain-containing protein
MSVKDPVCGMEIETKDAAGKSEFQGQSYYFCSEHCKKSFDKDPQKYVKPNEHSHHHHENH